MQRPKYINHSDQTVIKSKGTFFELASIIVNNVLKETYHNAINYTVFLVWAIFLLNFSIEVMFFLKFKF